MTVPSPAVDVLDQHDEIVRFGSSSAVPKPSTPFDAALAARDEETERLATSVARLTVRDLRGDVPARLRSVEQRYAVQMAPIERELARIPSNDGSAPADAARYLLQRQLDEVRANLRDALAREARAAGDRIDALARAQRERIAADADPPVLAPAEHAVLTDLLQDSPHLDADGRLAALEGVVGKLARTPVTASGRGLLRRMLALLRTASRQPEFDRGGVGTSDRAARLAALLFATERLARDPAVEGARRALSYLGRAEWELGELTRALGDIHSRGEVEVTLGRSALNSAGPGGFAVFRVA